MTSPAHAAARRPQPVLSRTAVVHVIAVLAALLVKLGAAKLGVWVDDHSDVLAGGVLLMSPFVSALLSARAVTPLSDPQSSDGTPLVPDPGVTAVAYVDDQVRAALDAAEATHPSSDAGYLSVAAAVAGLALGGAVLVGVGASLVVGIVAALIVAVLRGPRVIGPVRPAASPRRAMPAGTIGVTPGSGFVARLVRVVTRGPVAHAFIATGNGDEIIEGDPHGARRNRASHYRTVYWLTGLTDGMSDAQRYATVLWATAHLGTPYAWLDDAYIALVDLFGWAPAFMRRRLASTRTLMCSQLCDAAVEAGGRQLFKDGRPSGGVSPNDLFRLNYAERVHAPSLLGARVRTAAIGV